MEYIPYVYFIYHKPTKLKYIGVRYAKGCHPSDLWTSYFTSSKLVKKLITVFGIYSFKIRILHEYPNDPKTAILKEAEYFKTIKTKKGYMNITYSSGCIDLRIATKAGKIGGAIVKYKKLGICTDNKELKSKWGSIGGKVGGKTQAKLGLGFHQYKNNPELHKRWCSLGGIKGCISSGWKDPVKQAEKGRKGGMKNKGFVWYNDGNRSFKYTKKMQDVMEFTEFLAQNCEFKKGRTKLKEKNDRKN